MSWFGSIFYALIPVPLPYVPKVEPVANVSYNFIDNVDVVVLSLTSLDSLSELSPFTLQRFSLWAGPTSQWRLEFGIRVSNECIFCFSTCPTNFVGSLGNFYQPIRLLLLMYGMFIGSKGGPFGSQGEKRRPTEER